MRDCFKVSLIVLFCSGLYGCWFWSGTYERPVAEQEEIEEDQLAPLLVMTEDRLELLVESGAAHCIPGRLKSLQMQLADIRFDMDHGFLIESEKLIFNLFDEIEEAGRYLDLLNRRTECVSDFIVKSAEQQEIIRLLSRVNTLLNCNCKIFESESVLNSDFNQKLKSSVELIKDQQQVFIEVHKPETLADNFLIEKTLVETGLTEDQFTTYVYSEKTNQIGGGKPFFVAVDRIAYTGPQMKILREWELKQVTAESETK